MGSGLLLGEVYSDAEFTPAQTGGNDAGFVLVVTKEKNDSQNEQECQLVREMEIFKGLTTLDTKGPLPPCVFGGGLG